MRIKPAIRAIWNERRIQFKRPLWQEIQKNLFVFHMPLLLSGKSNRVAGRFVCSIRDSLLKKCLRKLRMRDPIVWFARHSMTDLIGVCREKIKIYHVVDEYAEYGNKSIEDKLRILQAERKMLSLVDLVIVVSERLLEAKKQHNPNTYLVHNGVSYEKYEQVMSSDIRAPHDMDSLPKPIIGYSGLISGRLDLGLLYEIANNNPDYSLVLIGVVSDENCENAMQKLQKLTNIHFLGFKPIDKIPHYIKSFDVCLIPYRVGEEANFIDPLKLYDYLACGKPVVSVDIPSVRPFADVIYIAENKQNFSKFINVSLNENGRLESKRICIARQNDWNSRIEQISKIIVENCLKASSK
jgi:glycosyltransferase involved in cell wall biosynthesis